VPSVSMAMNPAEEKAKPKAMRSRKRLHRRRRQVAYLAICGLSVALFAFALSTLIRPTSAQGKEGLDHKPIKDALARRVVRADDAFWGTPFRPGSVGHGTTHEKLGVPHWEPAKFTDYTGSANYSRVAYSPRATTSMKPVYEIIHYLHDNFLSAKDPVPEGYIVLKNSNTLALGPKVEKNDWRDLLQSYWVFLLVVLVLVLLIIIMPFIGFCYCCFCCCQSCRKGCPACSSTEDFLKRFFCGIFMLLLIIGLIFGIIIAFVTNKLLETGFKESPKIMTLTSEGTCTFLREVNNHVNHLLVNNYEEFQTHVMDHLTHADKHIFLDLTDVSGSDSMSELERVFENLPEAYVLMKEVQKWYNELKFYGGQLSDRKISIEATNQKFFLLKYLFRFPDLRGLKRDIFYATVQQCGAAKECEQFMYNNDIMIFGYSTCLHFETVPDPTVYVEAMEQIIKEKPHLAVQEGLKRLVKLGDSIKDEMDKYKSQMLKDFNKGKLIFMEMGSALTKKVESVISTIQMKSTRSVKSFDDVYDRFGPDRNMVSLIACLLIFLILVILVFALICGCFGSRRTGFGDECCSKSTASNCLVCAILLIFCVFSFVTLVGLFYLVIGFLTYQGACAPLRDREDNAIWRQLDSTINLNDYMPHTSETVYKSLPPLRMSKAIEACQANETIFELMRENNVYDANELAKINFLTESKIQLFRDDLSKYEVLTPSEEQIMNKASKNGLEDYHSSKFGDLCTKYTHLTLHELAEKMDSLAQPLNHDKYGMARITLFTAATNARNLHDTFVPKMETLTIKIRENLNKIDKLITYEKYDYGTTVQKLVAEAKEAQQFIRNRGKDFINVIHHNISECIRDDYGRFMENTVRSMLSDVGECGPLAFIFDCTINHICEHISDPINGFGVGLLLCAMLFLPILFVGHKLMCLYKKIYPYVGTIANLDGSDYLYDAYSERDREHVPLANVPKKRRKAYERRREQQDYYEDASPGVRNRSGGDRGGGGGDRGRRDDAPGSSRYNDMAPTHWDHDPPRYHNPPVAPPSSEYERPPPYYYPGASEQD
ncbi:hypothetical protein KR018_005373, partial [Drosophila ironensis]